MARVLDIFDSIGKAVIFSIIDAKQGFHQIPVDPKDVPKTAFSTASGHYEYLKMPFGLKGAPATFQRTMDQLLSGTAKAFTRTYLDDIIVFSNSPQEHLAHLQVVLHALRNSNFKANPDKCVFATTEVKYLGHILSEGTIRPNPEKLEAIQELPSPTRCVRGALLPRNNRLL